MHVVNLLARPEVQLGLPVAVEAPFHLQAVHLPHQGHFVDSPVTGAATNALGNMNAVIEIDEFRQIVNASPGDRAIGSPAFTDRLKDRGSIPDNAVTGHARLGRWDSSKMRVLHRS